jgi:hypothetical protein
VSAANAYIPGDNHRDLVIGKMVSMVGLLVSAIQMAMTMT